MASRKKDPASGSPFDALRSLRDELAKKPTNAPKAPEPPPRRKTTRAAREREAEDEALSFHRMLAGVEPLDRSRRRVPTQDIDPSTRTERAAKHAAEQVQREADTVHERLRSLVEGGERFEVSDDGRHVEGRRDDVSAEALRRLRRGLLAVDARLDLHGLGAQEARAELERFLAATRAQGERCVLVIHGKGEHSPQGMGVLRGEIAAWLSQGKSSRHVAAFATARASDGGEGAVYVLLRR